MSGAHFLEMAQTDLIGNKTQSTGHPVMVVVVVERMEMDTIQASTGIPEEGEKTERFWPVFMNKAPN